MVRQQYPFTLHEAIDLGHRNFKKQSQISGKINLKLIQTEGEYYNTIYVVNSSATGNDVKIPILMAKRMKVIPTDKVPKDPQEF